MILLLKNRTEIGNKKYVGDKSLKREFLEIKIKSRYSYRDGDYKTPFTFFFYLYRFDFPLKN
jgi:hypothetical protein